MTKWKKKKQIKNPIQNNSNKKKTKKQCKQKTTEWRKLTSKMCKYQEAVIKYNDKYKS